MSFRPRSRRRHLPRMQERVGGGFLVGFDPVRAAATSLTYNSEWDVVCGLLWSFDPVRTAATWLFPDALGGHQGISSNDYRVSVRNYLEVDFE